MRGPARGLLVGTLLVFLATSSGGLEISDAGVRFATAQSWLAGRAGDLGPEYAWNGATLAPNGKTYSYFGPLQSALMAPFIGVAKAVLPARPWHDFAVRFAISLVLFPALSALALVAAFQGARRFGATAREAFIACVAVGLGTLYWHYARTGQEEHLVALGFGCWLYGVGRLHAREDWGFTWAALGCSIAMLTRWSAAPLVFCLALGALAMVVRQWERRRVADVAAAVAVGAVALGALFAFNAYRFGSPLETGYGILFKHFNWPLFAPEHAPHNVLALLVSPKRGLLVYSPLLLLCVPFLVRGERVAAPVHWAVVGAWVCALGVTACYFIWDGGAGYGPRFLVSPIILLTPAMATALSGLARWKRVVLGLAIAHQALSTVLPATTEEQLADAMNQAAPGTCTPWSCGCTPVCLRPSLAATAVFNTVTARPGIVREAGAGMPPEQLLQTTDFRTLYWWPVRLAVRARAFLLPVGLLLAAGLGLFGGLILLRTWRALPESAGSALTESTSSPLPP